MAEEKEKKDGGVTVRVPQWVLDQIEKRLSQLPRPRPNRGDFLVTAWEAFTRKDDAKLPHVAKLEHILASGDEQAISAVTQNVDFFYDRLRPQTKHPLSRARKTGT